MNLRLDKIEITDLQARASTDASTIGEYAEAFKDGAKFPPVIVFHDGSSYFLADGFHRFFGAKEAELLDINAEVRKGNRDDALWFAVAANQTHGLKRTNADKRKAVELAVRHKPALADNAIAKHVGVSFHLVKEVRDQLRVLEVEVDTAKRTGSDGRERKTPPVPSKPVASIPPVPTRKTSPPPPEVVRDGTGLPIEQRLMPLWERRMEIQEMMTMVSAIRAKLKKAQEADDQLYARMNFSSAQSHLDQAFADIKSVKPFAVCPACQGRASDGCGLCKGNGMISEFLWTSPAVTESQRKFRKMAAEKK